MENKRVDSSIDVGYLLFKIRRYWYLFVIGLVIGLAWAYYNIRTSPKIYKFKSAVLIGRKYTGSQQASSVEIVEQLKELDKRNITDEIGILESLDLVLKTIKKLDFGISYFEEDKFRATENYKSSPFTVQLDSSQAQWMNTKIYLKILSSKKFQLTVKNDKVRSLYISSNNVDEGNTINLNISKVFEFDKFYKELGFKVKLKEKFKNRKNIYKKNYFFIINNIENIAKQYQKNLTLEPTAKDAYLVEITTQGQVPGKQIDFMNALMTTYVNDDKRLKNQRGNSTLNFIEDKLTDAQQKFLTSENNLAAYKSQKSITNIDNTAANTTRSLSESENEVGKLKTKLDNYVAVQKFVERNGENIIPLNLAINEGNMMQYVSILNNKIQERLYLQKVLKAEHPEIIRLNTEIANSQKNLSEYIKYSIDETQRSLRTAQLSLNNIKDQMTQLPIDEQKIKELETNHQVAKSNLVELQKQKDETLIRVTTNISDHKIVDQARMLGSGPVSPDPFLLYFMGTFLGLIAPLSFVILSDFLNSKITSKEIIQRNTDVPLLAILAKGKKGTKLALIDEPKSLMAESFRNLKIKLANLIPPHSGKNIIGITSTINDEGKSYCSANLGVALAVSNYKTLLICADMYQSDFEYFDLKEKGLSNYLKGEEEVYTTIQKTKVANLDIINCGNVATNPAELLTSPLMEDLLEFASTNYDYVIVDTPPIGFVSDYLVLEKHFKITLFMIRYNYSKIKLLNELNELYEDRKIENVYLVFNDVNFSSIYDLKYKDSKKIPAYYKQS
jgi:capsular exopolysaccharide synthesis family protein